jgi:hypothetical protein
MWQINNKMLVHKYAYTHHDIRHHITREAAAENRFFHRKEESAWCSWNWKFYVAPAADALLWWINCAVSALLEKMNYLVCLGWFSCSDESQYISHLECNLATLIRAWQEILSVIYHFLGHKSKSSKLVNVNFRLFAYLFKSFWVRYLEIHIFCILRQGPVSLQLYFFLTQGELVYVWLL